MPAASHEKKEGNMDKKSSYDKNLFIKIHQKEAGYKENIAKRKKNMLAENNNKLIDMGKCKPLEKLQDKKCRR